MKSRENKYVGRKFWKNVWIMQFSDTEESNNKNDINA